MAELVGVLAEVDLERLPPFAARGRMRFATAPQVNLYVVGPAQVPVDGFDAPDYDCKVALRHFVNAGTSTAYGPYHRSRVINNAAAANAFKDVLRTCEKKLRSQAALNDVVNIGICDQAAQTWAQPVSLSQDAIDGSELAPNACN